MTRTGFALLISATALLGACTGPVVHDFDKTWWSTRTNADDKQFAWAAVRCAVPNTAWEVSRDLEVRKFSSHCMRHYGFVVKD